MNRFCPCPDSSRGSIAFHVRALLFAALSLVAPLASQDLTSPLLSDSWQATFSNPALYGQARGNLTVGLPGLRNDLFLENVTYNQLVSEENGQRILNLNRLPDLLEERNDIRNDLSVETIGVGLKGEQLSMGFYHRTRTIVRMDYPKTLAQLLAQGNAQFIGQTVDISPFGSATNYHEIGLGASLEISSVIHLGARVKYLSGVGDARINPNSSLRLTTGTDNFALTLVQDLDVSTAGILDYQGLDQLGLSADFVGLSTEGIFGGNDGFALDLGLFLDFDRLRLQAAANDLGAHINWATDVTNLSFRGTDSFRGLDVLRDLLRDSVSFTTALDTLNVRYAPTESDEDYQSTIDATYLVGGEFDVTNRLTAGLLVVHYANEANAETAFALSARYRLLDLLTAGLVYNARRGTAANLGGHLYATVGPINLLLSTDNLLTVFTQQDNSRASVRLGASLSFGRGGIPVEKIPDPVQ